MRAKKKEQDAATEVVRATSRFRVWLPDDADERRRLLSALWSAQRLATTARNSLLRWYWLADAQELDRSLRETGAPPKPWTRAEPEPNAYKFVTGVVPALGTGVAAQVAKEVSDKWRQVRWSALVRQDCSPPHWRSDAPVPVRRQEARLARVGGDEYRLRVSLHSRKADFPVAEVLRIVAKDAYQRRLLSGMLDGTVRQRSVAIGYHRRKRQWWVRIAYSRLVEPRCGGKVAAVHRGMRFFLCAVVDSGEQWLYEGKDVEAMLRRMQARRRRRQRQVKASGRVGHGRKRTLATIEHLEGKAARYRETRCQVIARRLVNWLAERGVTRIVVEDLSGIRDAREDKLRVRGKKAKAAVWERVQEWPFYQLERRIAACAAETGLEVEHVSAAWNSTTWPLTGEPAEVDLKRWQMVGPGGKRMHLDVAAAKNVLRRASGAVMRESDSSDNEEAQSGRGGRKGVASERTRKLNKVEE